MGINADAAALHHCTSTPPHAFGAKRRRRSCDGVNVDVAAGRRTSEGYSMSCHAPMNTYCTTLTHLLATYLASADTLRVSGGDGRACLSQIIDTIMTGEGSGSPPHAYTSPFRAAPLL